ncbi:MAG TPA: hypothetical protein VGH23_18100 [Rhizomicrobium sp.]
MQLCVMANWTRLAVGFDFKRLEAHLGREKTMMEIIGEIFTGPPKAKPNEPVRKPKKAPAKKLQGKKIKKSKKSKKATKTKKKRR